ncbi:hypothetical protein OOT46_07390 [Aquabacterium sp. A7-Y]|uniref:hypothetical protein n=1 Tax=Aquabacterium sp. A7-Y TaxID=1349605 RepID=UPI00223E12C4|nr:hypothetical protein [Aquabacterium sp. A7-Y]MCW7537674.1 hypothetical protein [Aquabacterium sp. A7-Y]
MTAFSLKRSTALQRKRRLFWRHNPCHPKTHLFVQMLNLHAPIEPGRSAAGFKIGQQQSSVERVMKPARRGTYADGFNLNEAISENRGVLLVENFPIGDRGFTLYFGPDVVRLCFSTNGRLGCIYTFDGYLGTYNGVRIGAPLSQLTGAEPFEFDGGDEMYYRVDRQGQYIAGLAVVAAEADATEHESTSIVGYCVHDWTVFDTGVR